MLTRTELFRKKGVVNKFIEFTDDGLSSLAVATRCFLQSNPFGRTSIGSAVVDGGQFGAAKSRVTLISDAPIHKQEVLRTLAYV